MDLKEIECEDVEDSIDSKHRPMVSSSELRFHKKEGIS
jgi:hypothetical protein